MKKAAQDQGKYFPFFRNGTGFVLSLRLSLYGAVETQRTGNSHTQGS